MSYNPLSPSLDLDFLPPPPPPPSETDSNSVADLKDFKNNANNDEVDDEEEFLPPPPILDSFTTYDDNVFDTEIPPPPIISSSQLVRSKSKPISEPQSPKVILPIPVSSKTSTSPEPPKIASNSSVRSGAVSPNPNSNPIPNFNSSPAIAKKLPSSVQKTAVPTPAPPVQVFHSVRLNPNQRNFVEGMKNDVAASSLFQRQRARNVQKSIAPQNANQNGNFMSQKAKNEQLQKTVKKLDDSKIGNLANLLGNNSRFTPKPNANSMNNSQKTAPKDKVDIAMKTNADGAFFPEITITTQEEVIEDDEEGPKTETINVKTEVPKPQITMNSPVSSVNNNKTQPKLPPKSEINIASKNNNALSESNKAKDSTKETKSTLPVPKASNLKFEVEPPKAAEKMKFDFNKKNSTTSTMSANSAATGSKFDALNFDDMRESSASVNTAKKRSSSKANNLSKIVNESGPAKKNLTSGKIGGYENMTVKTEAEPVYLPENLTFGTGADEDLGFDKDVLEWVNVARTSPTKLVPYLKERLTKFVGNTNQFIVSKSERVVTHEGPKGVQDAIDFLNEIDPIGKLEWNNEVMLACKDHVDECGEVGSFTHKLADGSQPTERVLRRFGGEVGAAAESIKFRSDHPRDVVLDLIVDDGVQSRGNRKNLFNPVFDMFGCFTGFHKITQTMTTLLYVQSKASSDNMLDKVIQDIEATLEEPKDWMQKQQEVKFDGTEVTVRNVYTMRDGSTKEVIVSRRV